MASVTFVAFDGRVEFHTRHFSPLRKIQSEQVHKTLKEAQAPYLDEWVGWLDDFALFMALTENITFKFKGDEFPALLQFKDFWEKHESLPLTEQWLAFLDSGVAVRDAWLEAINYGAQPYFKPETAPGHMLTEEQRNDPK